MNENLKSDLKKLQEQYPELKNATIAFNDSAISLNINNGKENSGNPGSWEAGTSLCASSDPEPDVIKGHSHKVEVRKSPVHGYGVFAKEPIEQGELIEEARMLRLGWRKNYLHDPVLLDYVWGNISCKCTECENHGSVQFLALGLGSLYNHSDNPNTTQKKGYEKEVMTIKAARKIEKDEEIFVTYGKKYFLVRDFFKTVEKNKALEKYLESKREPH